MTTTTAAIGILALVGVGLVVYLAINAKRGRKSYEDIPPALRPGYSDDQLETRVIERYMAWGLVLTLFFAVFFPLYWLRESNRLNAETESFFIDAVVRGEDEFKQLCAECHGPEGQGGAAPSPYGEGAWPAPQLTNLVARYSENPNITDIRQFLWNTIAQGRPGTPMPAWGAGFGGPLNDQQIEDIIDWILANQVDEAAEASPASNLSGEELYVGNCAKCHGQDLEGVVAPSLVGVFDRHTEGTILGILRNGIKVPTGVMMPPWQNGYMYSDARYTDEALQRIVDYLRERQGAEPGPSATEA